MANSHPMTGCSNPTIVGGWPEKSPAGTLNNWKQATVDFGIGTYRPGSRTRPNQTAKGGSTYLHAQSDTMDGRGR